jgi:hypothetical protein
MKNILLTISVVSLLLSGCVSDANQARINETNQQGSVMLAILNNQPVPDLNGYSFERDIVIQILLARNKSTVTTWAYWRAENTGELQEVCRSVGFPIPYSVQLTSPEFLVGSQGATLPQAEPNALYSPPSAEASWVLCMTDDGKKVYPLYSEPRVISSPRRIKSASTVEYYDNTTSVEMRTGGK